MKFSRKDMIDERDFREKCSKSIVKGYNVHYITKEELEAARLANAQEEESSMESGGNAAVMQDNEAMHEEAQEFLSGYGSWRDDDPVTREQIEKILGEREEHLQETIEELKN